MVWLYHITLLLSPRKRNTIGQFATRSHCDNTLAGDALDVIQAYTVQHPSNSLAKYIPALKLLALNRSDSTSLLAGYCKAWMNEAKQTAFQNIQMAEVTTTYYQPSQQMADALGVQYALSRAFLYDTIIQHGGGDDGDSLAAIVNRTNTELGGSPAEGVDETIWLPAMISKRREDLLHPDNAATADQWAQSTNRTDVYAQLVATSQWALAGAVHFNTTDYPEESLATNNTMATNSANCGTRSEVNATTESFMDLASPISGGSSLFLASSTVLGALTLTVLLLS